MNRGVEDLVRRVLLLDMRMIDLEFLIRRLLSIIDGCWFVFCLIVMV